MAKRIIFKEYELLPNFYSFAIRFEIGKYFSIDIWKNRYVWYNEDYYNNNGSN